MTKLIVSSALIIYRKNPQFEVVLVKRNKNQRAFPGPWVFPGGKVDNNDSQIPVDKVHPLKDLIVCAVREFFEETGILPGFSGDPAKLTPFREQLLRGEDGFNELCRLLNYQVPVSKIINLGRRVTPPITPVRFDTHYFLLEEVGA